MKRELNENQVDLVVGGSVVISANKMKVCFTTMAQAFPLHNCTYREAYNYVDQLLDENPNLNNEQFDQFCYERLREIGWI